MLMRLFTFILTLGLWGNSLFAEASSCEIGKKIRNFSNLTNRDELTALVNNPLFAKDDEKYVDALLRLNDKAKIAAFVARADFGSLSSSARERRARALLKLVSVEGDKVKQILYVSLAETQAARTISAPTLDDAQWLKRLDVLSERNDNELVISEILKRKEGKTRTLGCHVEFLLGKAFRKNRNYNDSIKTLDKVATSCSGNEALNAAFLLARLSAITPSKENMKYFAQFRKKYPDHSYVDDVLLFKASALESLGRKEEAKSVLREIWEMKTVADMRYEAVFRLAFMYALEDKSKEAIEILQASLSMVKEPSPTRWQTERAKYWLARLRIFPDVADLETKKVKIDASTRLILEDLAKSSNLTFYTWMGKRLLARVDEKPVLKSPLTQAKPLVQPVEDANFKTILCLFASGYKQEARDLVALFEAGEVHPDQRMPIARKLFELREFSDAFRFAQSALNESATNPGQETLNLMYPQAYAEEIENASTRVGSPQYLLYGLMREESRFDARAISWAGARGAFQLMPNVARAEAARFKMKDLSLEQMLDPKVSILLGSAYLKGILDDFKHPLFAVAAYNAGVKRVKTWEQRWGDYKAIDAFVENIPLPETREYVKRVGSAWLNYARLYGNNESPFSFEISER